MRKFPALLLTALLTACGADAPPPAPAAPAPAAPLVAAPIGPAPGCIGTLGAPQLPESWRDGLTQETTAGALAPAGSACVLALFRSRLRNPGDLDPVFAPLREFHADAPTPDLARLQQPTLHLFRVTGTGGGGLWLLRADGGSGVDAIRYDVVFATDAGGVLTDQMLAGVVGKTFRRTYDLSTMQMNVRETTRRDEGAGPAYSGVYGVLDGRLVLVESELVPEAGDARLAAPSTLLTVPGPYGDLAAVRAGLFTDDGVRAELVREQRDGDTRRILAIGATDAAGHVVHVLSAATTQADAGATHYVVASHQSTSPPNALAAKLGTPQWAPATDGMIALTIPVTYSFLREGGDPNSTAPMTYDVEGTIALRFDPASGELTPAD